MPQLQVLLEPTGLSRGEKPAPAGTRQKRPVACHKPPDNEMNPVQREEFNETGHQRRMLMQRLMEYALDLAQGIKLDRKVAQAYGPWLAPGL
jgi:hypothetical protein